MTECTPRPTRKFRRSAIVGFAGAMITVAGVVPALLLASPAHSAGVRKPATTVIVTENEFTIKPSTVTVPAGRVRFVVTNTGKVIHDLIVLRTNATAIAIPTNRKTGRPVKNGKRVKDVGEVPDIKVGAIKSDTIKLGPGHYVLACSLPGHFTAGMYLDFQVV